MTTTSWILGTQRVPSVFSVLNSSRPSQAYSTWGNAGTSMKILPLPAQVARNRGCARKARQALRGPAMANSRARAQILRWGTHGPTTTGPGRPGRPRGKRSGGIFLLSSAPRPAGPHGEVSEWLKVPDSKSGVAERSPWVRIPPSPPTYTNQEVSSLQTTPKGEVSEWSKELALECQCGFTLTVGSNPTLSAAATDNRFGRGFMPRATVPPPTPPGPEGSNGNGGPGARGTYRKGRAKRSPFFISSRVFVRARSGSRWHGAPWRGPWARAHPCGRPSCRRSRPCCRRSRNRC